MKKTFGIIGAGNIAKAVAPHLLKAGYEVILSNSKGPDSLKDTITALGAGAKAGTTKEAAEADMVLLALHWGSVPGLTNLLDWKNRIVIDATNHYITFDGDFKDWQVQDLGGKASSEVIEGLLPGARIVKAFNTLLSSLLASEPKEAIGNRVIFVSGNDEVAKGKVKEVIKAIGFAPVDLGTLGLGSKLQQAKGPLSGLNLVLAG